MPRGSELTEQCGNGRQPQSIYVTHTVGARVQEVVEILDRATIQW